MSEINVDPMKKSSIYATFGRYYGEKLYKLLYDCCSGRPGSFCYEVLSCLGISSQGDNDKVLTQQGNWKSLSQNIYEFPEYADNASAIAGGLESGQIYYTNVSGEYILKVVH